MAAHRYWRIVPATTTNGSQWGLSEVDFWEGEFGPSALTRPFSTTSTGAGSDPDSKLVDGAVGASVVWIRSLPCSFGVDFGAGVQVEIHRVLLWGMNAGNSYLLTGEVQSSDDGVSWATEWALSFVAGDYESVSGWRWPASSVRPSAPANPSTTPLLPRFGDVLYHLDPALECFSDNGSTPATDGDGVYLARNQAPGTGLDDFVQTSSGSRLTWRQSGVLDLPYLEGTSTTGFEAVAYTQPSGVATVNPYMVFAAADGVSRTSGAFPTLWGAAANYKGVVYLRPGNAGQEINVGSTSRRYGDYLATSRIFSAALEGVGFTWSRVDSMLYWYGSVSNLPSTAMTTALPLTHGANANPGFAGDLYSLIVVDGASPVDFVLISEWLRGKYVVGFSDGGIDIDVGSGALEITGVAPTVTQPIDPALPVSGHLTIAGVVPTAFSGIYFTPSTGGLVIDGGLPLIYDNEAAILSQQAVLVLGEVIPPVHVAQQATLAAILVEPPVRVSQQAILIATDGAPCVSQRCQLWLIQRRDGVEFAYTSHDQDVVFAGRTYRTCRSLDPSASASQSTLGSTGDIQLTGIIDDEGISEADLFGGLFDDAFVTVDLYSWGDVTEAPRRLASGWTGSLSQGDGSFKMEVLGAGARIDQQALVQEVTPGCRWTFGSSQCGVDAEALMIDGVVTSAPNRNVVYAALSDGDGGHQWENGRLRFTSGSNAGLTLEVREVDFDTGRVSLWPSTATVASPGDEFDLIPGCDRTRDGGCTLYGNVINFGGFPDVPGSDAILETPDAKY